MIDFHKTCYPTVKEIQPRQRLDCVISNGARITHELAEISAGRLALVV